MILPTFDRPIGANSDLKELEYISALHQTCVSNVRKDASIDATDIASLLCSKYGIKISTDDVRKFILEGYAGGDDTEEVLDLSEIVSILIIPYLLKKVEDMKEADDKPETKSDVDVFSKVLGMILTEVTGSATPEELNTELLSKIFAHYGEYELSNDHELLVEMVQLASPSTTGESISLDKKSFGEALTNDVLLFSRKNEVQYIFARMLDNLYGNPGNAHDIEEIDVKYQDVRHEVESFKTVHTAPSIDLIINSVHSRFLLVLLWSYFLISYWAYIHTAGWHIDYSPLCPDTESICRMGIKVLDWTVKMLILVCVGLLQLRLTSAGNGSHSTKVWPLLIGIISLAFVTFFPFFLVARNNFDFLAEYADNPDVLHSRSYMIVVYLTALVLGCAALLRQFHVLCKIITNSLAPRSINRKAIDHKVEIMVENALNIRFSDEGRKEDGDLKQSVSNSLLTFMKASDSTKTEKCGGFIWCLKKICNKDLFFKEGIALPTRLVAGNFTLLFVTISILDFGINQVLSANENYREGYEQAAVIKVTQFVDSIFASASTAIQATINEAQEFIEDLPSLFLNHTCPTADQAAIFGQDLDFTNFTDSESVILCSINDFNISSMLDYDKVGEKMKNFVNKVAEKGIHYAFEKYYPSEKRMVIIPLIVTAVISFLTSFCLMLVYIPSTITSIMRLRNGDIPTLRDRNFNRFRKNQDYITMILGGMFWSALYSSVLCGFIVGFIVFLFLWQVTRAPLLGFLYYAIGIVITIIMKKLLLLPIRSKLHTAFYRKTPASANIIAIALECWNIGISSGVAIARAVKLLVVTILHIGRIDIPLISSDNPVSRLDSYPSIFMQNILASEAHSHPYIELLGAMYMMRLQFGKQFATRAGSSWRLLFVTALMPWVSKYRVVTRRKIDVDDDILDTGLIANSNKITSFGTATMIGTWKSRAAARKSTDIDDDVLDADLSANSK